MSDKCNTCMLRYPCDEQTEWECKHNSYRHYKPDTSKIEMLEGRAPTGCQESRRPKTARELKDTIDLMTSADYKDRFRAEYWQTLIRAHKLQTLLQKHKDGALDFTPDCPIELLHIQLVHMRNYLDVLRERAAVEGVKLEWPKQEGAPKTEEKTYLAVFSFTNREGDQGISNVDIGVAGNPSCVDNIREVEQGLKDAFGYTKVILLNLIPLEG